MIFYEMGVSGGSRWSTLVLFLLFTFLLIYIYNWVGESSELIFGLFFVGFVDLLDFGFFLLIILRKRKYRVFIEKVRDLVFEYVERDRRLEAFCIKVWDNERFLNLLSIIVIGTIGMIYFSAIGGGGNNDDLLIFIIIMSGVFLRYFEGRLRLVRFLKSVNVCIIKGNTGNFEKLVIEDVIFNRWGIPLSLLVISILLFFLFYRPEIGIRIFVIFLYIVELFKILGIMKIANFIEISENYEEIMSRLREVEKEFIL